MDFLFEGNWCKAIIASWIFAMVALGTLMNIFEAHLPVFITRTFRYGKYASTAESKLVKNFEIPKSYFRHFYIGAAFLFSPVFIYELANVYVYGNRVSSVTMALLDLTCGSHRKATVSATCTFLASCLIFLQIVRRFYDTMFVSVFSKNATMNLVHYIIGWMHYPVLMLLILSEAPKFAHYDKIGVNSEVSLWSLSLVDLLATGLFLWAWIHQHNTTKILANLRTDERGQVVSNGYKLPQGDWFSYFTSPHCIAEVLMYTALTLILWQNSGWWFVYAWVVSNQVETILLSHWWYQSTFKGLPKERKALIPFVY